MRFSPASFKTILQCGALALAYFLAGKLTQQLTPYSAGVNLVWSPTGIALGSLLVWGKELWPGVFIGSFSLSMMASHVPLSSFGVAIGNALEAWVGALIVNRLAQGRQFFGRPQDIYKYIVLAALASPVVSATLGLSVRSALGLSAWSGFAPLWFTWWLGHMAGTIAFAPLIVLWATQSTVRKNPWQIAEVVLFVVVIWITLRGVIPYHHAPSHDSVLILQIFLGVIAIMGVTAAAIMETEFNARKDLEQKVEERTALLTAANKELESFSYSVSHDLRTPLRAIDGYSRELLSEAEHLGERQKSDLTRLRAAAARMGQIIDDLLNLSRVSRAELRKEAVDLSALATEITGDLQKASPERRAAITIGPTPMTQGDTRLLRIVLENLFGNAWKFTGKRPMTEITFGITAVGDDTPFFIKDNGAGFDMKFAPKLFGAFQRLHDETDFPGTGVGLATVQRIIHRHGGRLWAESKEDAGATFYFTLPEGTR